MPDFLTKIPILFVAFVIFLVILNVKIRKSNKEQSSAEEAFWERERLANATRKQDITNLPYITIPKEIIPQNLGTASEKALIDLSEQKILNLTGKTNTDLKMEYGVANLETLSACDDRFAELVKHLVTYSKELMDAGQTQAAQALLEFGVSVKADAKPIYIRLGQIYMEAGQPEKVTELIASAEELDSLAKHGIIADLKALSL